MAPVIFGATQLGVDSRPVSIETQIIGSTRRFTIIGLPDSILRESRDRIRCAIENSGFSFPNREVIVSLAPAALPKKGAGFDLAIALSVLAACGNFSARNLGKYLAFGELKLDGSVLDLPGTLAAAVLAQQLGRGFLAPSSYLGRHPNLEGSPIYGIRHLREAIELFRTGVFPDPPEREILEQDNSQDSPNFSDVVGQHSAKRAMEIAAAGGHNVLMVGPPGAGKSMIAARMNSLLPELSLTEMVEVMKVRESVGISDSAKVSRPFRAPHHTTSYAGLIGGGSIPSAGEVSLAHRGVLFLDELPEFRRDVLETLRQPLESKSVLISRAARQIVFPADFTLIAAMNPCPCGRLGKDVYKNNSAAKSCECLPGAVKRYTSKISGPLLDRFDIFLWLRPIPAEQLDFSNKRDDQTEVMRQRVLGAVKLQKDRFPNTQVKNSAMSGEEVQRYCQLERTVADFLNNEAERIEMSSRAYVRVLRLSRTIADLEQRQSIVREDIAEAIRYRVSPSFTGDI